MSLIVLFSVLGSGAGDYDTDTDGDGISDGEELDFVGTDPSNYDTDFDGAGDGEEYYGGYNPNDPSDHPGSTAPEPAGDPPPADPGPSGDPSTLDSDEDGLTDAEEINGLPIQVYTFSPDGFGPDTFEGQQGTWSSSPGYAYPDPNNPDSDGDLWPDGFEYFTQHNPTDPADGNADDDGDLLSNGYEYTIGTNWEVANTDGDVFGLDDGIEVLALGTDPLDPNDPADEPQPEPAETDGSGGADPAAAGGGSSTGGEAGSTGEGGGADSSTPNGGGSGGGGPAQGGEADQSGDAAPQPLSWTLEVRTGKAGWTPDVAEWPEIPSWERELTYEPYPSGAPLLVRHAEQVWVLVGSGPSTGDDPSMVTGDQRWDDVVLADVYAWQTLSSTSTTGARGDGPGRFEPEYFTLEEGAAKARAAAIKGYDDDVLPWVNAAGAEGEWFDTGARSVEAAANATLLDGGEAEALQVRLKLNRPLQEGEAPFSVTFVKVTAPGNATPADDPTPGGTAPTAAEAITLTVQNVGERHSAALVGKTDRLTPQFAKETSETVGLYSLEIVDRAFSSMSALKIARMEESLSADGALEPHMDEDRFYFQLGGAAKVNSVRASLGTIDNPEDEYDDDHTTISLLESSGVWRSGPHVLVSDAVDDAPDGSDDEIDDSTHLGQAGGVVRISEVQIDGQILPVDIRAPIRKRKDVTLNVVVFEEAGVTKADVEKHIARFVRERFAQTGIRIVANVDEAPWNPAFGNHATFYLRETDAQGQFYIPDGAKELMRVHGTTSTLADIHIFVLKSLWVKESDGTLNAIGGAGLHENVDWPYLEQAFRNNIFFRGVNPGTWTMSHELGHLYTDKLHFGDDYAVDADPHVVLHNLMRKDQATPNDLTIEGPKRIFIDQDRWAGQ